MRSTWIILFILVVSAIAAIAAFYITQRDTYNKDIRELLATVESPHYKLYTGNEMYRLGDMVGTKWRWFDTNEEYHMANFPESIACEYMRRTQEISDIPTLSEIVRVRSENVTHQARCAVIHLRVGDVIEQNTSNVETILSRPTIFNNQNYTPCLSYFEPIMKRLKKKYDVQTIVIVAGSHSDIPMPKSCQYIATMEQFFKQHGFKVFLRLGGDPDSDFVYMTTARIFVPSTGGTFTMMAKAVSSFLRNTVVGRGIVPSLSLSNAQSVKNTRFPNIPIYVLNIPSKPDRREHMENFLLRLGVESSSIEFMTNHPDIVLKPFDKYNLVSTGELTEHASMNFNDELIANGVTHMRWVRKIAESGVPGIIMEDDLMALVPEEEVGSYLNIMLEELPEDWDMLYMEYCYESCDNIDISGRYLYRLDSPICAAAILFSPQGARKVLKLCSPMFNVIDWMYKEIIESGEVKAYGCNPALFGQDAYWGSTLSGEKGSNVHKLRVQNCLNAI